MTVGGQALSEDVAACQDAATQSFAHVRGSTSNFGSNAGIVRALSGQGNTHYIVVVSSNLGFRFTDEALAPENTEPADLPCNNGLCFTQRIPFLGKAIHDHMAPWFTTGDE